MYTAVRNRYECEEVWVQLTFSFFFGELSAIKKLDSSRIVPLYSKIFQRVPGISNHEIYICKLRSEIFRLVQQFDCLGAAIDYLTVIGFVSLKHGL